MTGDRTVPSLIVRGHFTFPSPREKALQLSPRPFGERARERGKSCQERHPELYKANQKFCHPELDSESSKFLCEPVCARSSRKIQGLSGNRFRIKSGMTGDCVVPSLIVRGQNFLKNVVNLEIRERVKSNKLDSFGQALRMTNRNRHTEAFKPKYLINIKEILRIRS